MSSTACSLTDSLSKMLFGARATPVRLSTDDALEILSNSRRREVIRLVATTERVWTLDMLAREIARQENGYDSAAQLSSAERSRVYVGLYQSHLDKLDAAGAIAYEHDIIREGPNTQALADLMTVVDERVEP